MMIKTNASVEHEHKDMFVWIHDEKSYTHGEF